MASPAPASQSEVPATSTKKLRTPAKDSGKLAKLLVPKLKTGLTPAVEKLKREPLSNSRSNQDSLPVPSPLSQARGEPLYSKLAPTGSSHNIVLPRQEGGKAKKQALSAPPAALGEPAKQSSTPVKTLAQSKPTIRAPTRPKAAESLSSPNYSPRNQAAVAHPESAAEVPLACQTAISKRRSRQQTMMERYGDFFSGSEFELDETLIEYCAQPSAASTRGCSRKSAGPSVLAAEAAAAASLQRTATGRPDDAPVAQRGALSRQRRRTLAPGQVVAKEVDAIMKDLTNKAGDLLPGDQAPGISKASAKGSSGCEPLHARLLDSWHGKSYYERLEGMAQEEQEPDQQKAHAPRPVCKDSKGGTSERAVKLTGPPPARVETQARAAGQTKRARASPPSSAAANCKADEEHEPAVKLQPKGDVQPHEAPALAVQAPETGGAAAPLPPGTSGKHAPDSSCGAHAGAGSGSQTGIVLRTPAPRGRAQAEMVQPEAAAASRSTPQSGRPPRPARASLLAAPSSPGDKGMIASLQKQLAEVQQQKALLERKHSDLQGKLQSSVMECQQLRARAELKEKQQKEKDHKSQTSLLAEQRQVRKLQAELDERAKAAASDKERAKAALGTVAGSMSKHSDKLQSSADAALEGMQALMARLKLVAHAASTARQLQDEL